MVLNMLVILMVRESGLRSALAARLALSGLDVVSMEQVDAARIGRLGGVAPVLVADVDAACAHPGGLAALGSDPLWKRLLIIGADGDPAAAHIHHVGRDNPGPAIAALLRPAAAR